jgi:succinate-acetate transporter protein
MIKKIDLGPAHRESFGEPTPLGLLGLAVGCAALVPIAFGVVEPGLGRTTAILCLLFGAGCQFLAGIMNLANKNVIGGTLLTTFSFNWTFLWWLFSSGKEPFSHSVVLAVEIVFLVIFLVFTYGFGFYSKLLFVFLLDIDVMSGLKIARALLHTRRLEMPIAATTVILGLLSLWIAFAMLINPVAGRAVFRIPGPLFTPHRAGGFDWSLRQAIFGVLYDHWKERAYEPLALAELESRVRARVGDQRLAPDLAYLADYGALVLDAEGATVRLNAAGIDLHEQLILKKFGS